MQIPSRRIIVAALAGAAALLPFAAGAPAEAAPSDGIPTAATMTVTMSAPTVVIGGQAGWSVQLDEVPGGQPDGLTGRVDIEVTQNGTTIDSVVRAVRSADQTFASSFVTTAAGPIDVSAIFVQATQNESGAKGSASMIVLGKASVSVQATTVHAGDSIVPVVDLPSGSANADGRLQATAAGLPTLVCGPRIVSDTSASCPLQVPTDIPSGTYTMTFTYGASPFYADASTTADVQVIGTTSTGTTTSAQTGTSGTVTRTGSGGGTRTSGIGAGSVVAAGTATGGFTTGSTGSGATGAATTGGDTTATDAPTVQPTTVAEQLPAGKSPVGTATSGSPVLTILPMLIPFAAAGLIGLLLVVLLIVLLVRRARRGAAA